MITNPKTLVDMGANAAIMAAFAIPGAGAAVAAGLGAGLALFDIFFQLPDRTDPGTLTPTRNDLQNSINELKQFITDVTFENELTSRQAHILTLNDQLNKVWSQAATGDEVNDRARRGPLNATLNSQLDSWLKQIDDYKEVINKPDPELLDTINWLELKSNYCHRTLGLYTLAASLWVNFCKLNIAFEYILAKRQDDGAEAKYNEDENNYLAAHNKWKAIGQSKGDPEPQSPTQPIPTLNDENFLNGSTFAGAAKDLLVRAIAYADGLLQPLLASYANRAADFKSRLSAITLSNDGGKWFYIDSKTGKSSSPETLKSIAEGQMNMYMATMRGPLWDRLTSKYELTGVDIEDADLHVLAATIDSWRDADKIFSPK